MWRQWVYFIEGGGDRISKKVTKIATIKNSKGTIFNKVSTFISSSNLRLLVSWVFYRSSNTVNQNQTNQMIKNLFWNHWLKWANMNYFDVLLWNLDHDMISNLLLDDIKPTPANEINVNHLTIDTMCISVGIILSCYCIG